MSSASWLELFHRDPLAGEALPDPGGVALPVLEGEGDEEQAPDAREVEADRSMAWSR